MSLFKRSVTEGLGTFWLVLGGCGSAVLAAAFPAVGIGLLGVALAFGLTVLTMALLLTDMDFYTALSAVLASVNCAGVGWGELGPSTNFAGLTSFQLSVTTLGMLMGRLEILSFLALLTPAFWRR